MGNKDSNTIVRYSVPLPVVTSSVMFFIIDSHKNAGLRLELYGCDKGEFYGNDIWSLNTEKKAIIRSPSKTSTFWCASGLIFFGYNCNVEWDGWCSLARGGHFKLKEYR